MPPKLALLLLALSVAALIGVRLRAQPAATPAVPYKNPALPVDRRARDYDPLDRQRSRRGVCLSLIHI